MKQKYPEYKQLNLTKIADDVLSIWEEKQAFEKSVSLREGNIPFVFYEGPPSANGMPGIHHVISRTLKDLICRYKTMQGFQVKRKGGWDTHGLPVELGVEKLLGITKEDIGKKITVEEYNETCRREVLKFKDKWDELTQKMGYWVDLKHPYITFENNYIETLWWCLKELYNKGLLYESVSIQPYSPAAGTGLSSHELNQPGTYKDVKDTSVVAMFRAIDKEKLKSENVQGDIFFLAWTTTPWTLPSNLGLTVGPNIDYVLLKTFNPYTHLPVNVILAKTLLHKYFKAENEDGDFTSYNEKTRHLPWKILASFKGKDLAGIAYEQLLPYEANTVEKIREITPGAGPFKIITGDFVTTEDGTGIVHTAPAFGADDFKAGQKNNLGIITLVDKEGKFVDGVGEFSQRFIKNYKDDPHYTDVNVDISVKLKKENRAFKVEKYEHSYPHCWRTDKPVIYYPLDAWFIKTTAVKERMIALNNTINWKPAFTGTGRFGNWLENMVDWNLSRSRFWGTPLPVWRTDDGGEEKCIGSIDELKRDINNYIKKGGRAPAGYLAKVVIPVNIYSGIEALRAVVRDKKDVYAGMHRYDLPDIDEISFFYGKEGDSKKEFKGGFGLSHIIAKRNSEDGKGIETAIKMIEVLAKGTVSKSVEAKQTVHLEYENYEAVLSKDYFGEKQTWLLTGWRIKKDKPDAKEEFSATSNATHTSPTFSREDMGADLSDSNIQKIISGYQPLDLHKPFVDEIIIMSESGKPMKRIPDLIDVWFDSGAMPYAQRHFPFENKEEFAKNFPADFIAEGVDQTRGWFYTLHALAALLFDSVAYKTVVSNGLVLDKNGIKMSKRLGNIVDPFETLEIFGPDATRWYLITNASPWESLKFDIEGIKEVQRKFFGTLYNTYQFFALYANVDGFIFKEETIPVSERPEIDRWIISSLNTLNESVTKSLDDYEPTAAGRAIEKFVDEYLSNWYVRLSRRRFWKPARQKTSEAKAGGADDQHDKICAYQTLYESLETVSRLMAPVAPFFADWLFLNLNNVTGQSAAASVHHLDFPKADQKLIDTALEERMQLAQDVSSLILSLRKKVNIKVRQPLEKVIIPSIDYSFSQKIKRVEEIIKSETNIKEVELLPADNDFIKKKAKANFKTLGKKLGAQMKWAAEKIQQLGDEEIGKIQEGNYLLNPDYRNNQQQPILISNEDIEISTNEIAGFEVAIKGNLTVALDIVITENLKNEGFAREFINRIQNLRKDKNFELTDKIMLQVVDDDVALIPISQYNNYICAEILADKLEFVPKLADGITIDVNNHPVTVSVTKKGN